MASQAKVIRDAQHGVAIDRFLPPGRTPQALVVADLGPPQRLQVVDTFTALLEGLYAHLPLKRGMYAIDPVQRLRLLRQRVERLDPVDFHYELADIITDLRDAHTRYVGPPEFDGRVAMLPFLVEAFGPVASSRYIVSKIAADRSLIGRNRFFAPGVEIRWWNAMPMDRAVDRHADDETGGRPDARRARAVESMTLRALQYGPPPDERWVVIGFVDLHGVERELRVDWRVVAPQRAATSGQSAGGQTGRAFGIDPAAEIHRRVKKLLFKPELWYADRRRPKAVRARPAVAVGENLPTSMPDALAAKVHRVRGQSLGYLRLWSFDVDDDEAYVAEVIRLLTQLPDRGLIIDLRSNPGGLIWAAERLFQLFTPHPVAPNRFSLLATTMTRAMAGAAQNGVELAPWRASLEDAVANGEPYSLTAPITTVDACNNIGQVYGGPVVAVVDPNTYSAGDLFAAGFVDNSIGPLISVGEATGAGGANVWAPADVNDALLGTPYAQQPLPAGIGYTLAVRRATRAGPADGAAIEDVGVRGDYQYAMTRADLTGSNEDLLSFAGKHVLGLPRTSMTVSQPAADKGALVVRTLGIDRLDVVVDDSFQPSRAVRTRTTAVDLPPGWSTVELRGSASGQLVQRRVLRR
jgi:Peptidase family S41